MSVRFEQSQPIHLLPIKTKSTLMLVGLLVAAGLLTAAIALNFPRLRFTVHVIGEDGKPISGVKNSYIFNEDSSTLDKIIHVEGVTDANGNFSAEGYSQYGVVAGELLSNNGYYLGWASLPTFNHEIKDGHWQPWDQTYTTVLRKIGNPIPMYVKLAYSEIPEVDQSCGFDLEAGDWIAPWGEGMIADFLVTLKRQYVNDRNYDDTVTISFSNPGDGIQEVQLPMEFAMSQFKWPRMAPEDGYQPSLAFHLWEDASGMHGDRGEKVLEKKYFFRVRTVKQGNQIISALYGKINQGIEIHPASSKTCGITISYYLNPSSLDRNMEWDPTKNLAPTPKDPAFQVHQP